MHLWILLYSSIRWKRVCTFGFFFRRPINCRRCSFVKRGWYIGSFKATLVKPLQYICFLNRVLLIFFINASFYYLFKFEKSWFKHLRVILRRKQSFPCEILQLPESIFEVLLLSVRFLLYSSNLIFNIGWSCMCIVAVDTFEMDELVEVLWVCILSYLLILDVWIFWLWFRLLLSWISWGCSWMCILPALHLARAIAAMTKHIFPVINLLFLLPNDFLCDFHTVLPLMTTAPISYAH